MEYKKTSTRSKMSGDWYEVKLPMLVFLRSLNDRRISHFELATNVDGTGAFDDLVYRVVTVDKPNCTQSFFVQLKHKETATLSSGSFQSLTGDFSLNKYLKSFIEVRERNNGGDHANKLLLEGPFQSFSFIIYTTAPLHKKLQPCVEAVDLELVGDIFNSCSDGDATFKFKRECYSEVVTLRDDEEHLKSDITSFLEKFVLFGNQKKEHEFDVLLKKELSSACLEAAGFEEPLYRIVEGLFKKWWRDDKSVALTGSSDILRRAVEKLSFEVELTGQTRLCTVDVKFNPAVWEKFDTDSVSLLHVVSEGRSLRLAATKTLHALRAHRLSTTCVTLTYFLMRASALLEEWESGYIDCLVLVTDDSKPNIEEGFIFFITLSKKIKNILEKDSQKKCVIVSRKNSVLAANVVKSLDMETIRVFNDTFHIQDLENAFREDLHKRLVSLQESDVDLQSLVDRDVLEKLVDQGLIEDLVSSERVVIGGLLPDVIPYFIRRHFKRRELSSDILTGLTLANFLIISGDIDSFIALAPLAISLGATGGGETDEIRHRTLVEMFGEDVISSLTTVFPLRSVDAARIRYDLLSQVRGNIHWVHFENGTLNWIKSSKNTMIIEKYTKEYEMNCESLVELNDRVTIIIAEPGMGKTILLADMVRVIKRKNPSDWVIHLNLSEHCALFEPTTPLTALEFLSLALSLNPLEKAILRSGLEKTGKVSVLLDSFDEVCPAYEEAACDLIKALLKTRIRKLVVTSRHCSEETLKLLLLRTPVNLVEFSESDQRRFFEKFWGQSVTPERLDYVITKVMETMHTIDPENKIMGIPLQTMMVAEVFHDYVIDPENNAFTENMDIIDLYEKFIDKKFKIFYAKSKDKTLRKSEIRTNFQMDHMYAAMVLLFSFEQVKCFRSVDDIVQRANSFLLRTDEARDNSGIVVRSIKNKPVFIHKTFAEFFVALCFSIQYELNIEFLRDHIFQPNYHFVRTLFDRILAKGHPLHEAVLNKDLSAMEVLLAGGFDVDSRDAGGRTALHLAAALGMEVVRVLPSIIYYNDDRFIGPLNQHPVRILLEHSASVNVSDHVLNWRPIDYAVTTSSWDSVEMLLESGAIANDTSLFSKTFRLEVNKLCNLMLCNGYVNTLQLAVKEGVPIEFQAVRLTNSTLFHKASFVGYIDVLNLMLNSDSSILPHVNRLGYTCLFFACRGMQCHVIRLLIRKGANYLARQKSDGYTCLHMACIWGYTHVVKTLLDAVAEIGQSVAAFVNAPSGREEFALTIAYEHRHMDIVKLLLYRGADVSIYDSHGLTCLHTACIQGDIDILTALVEGVSSDGASVQEFLNTLTKNGKTPLSLACRNQHWDIVRLLVTLGANYLATDTDGYSCLHRYCVWGDINTVTVLVDCVRDKGDSVQEFVNTLNAVGDSPLKLARRYKNNEVAEFLQLSGAQDWGDVTEELCSACVKDDTHMIHMVITHVKSVGGLVEDFLNICNESGQSPLTLACGHNSLRSVEMLLAHGADPSAMDSNGSLALHVACDMGDGSIISMLVDHLTRRGMSVDVPNLRGESALSRSCRYRRLDAVRLLLSHGADATARDQHGFTPLHNACVGGDAAVVRMLVDHIRAQDGSVHRFINVLSISHVSPMDLALRHNQLHVVNYFLSLRERIKFKSTVP